MVAVIAAIQAAGITVESNEIVRIPTNSVDVEDVDTARKVLQPDGAARRPRRRPERLRQFQHPRRGDGPARLSRRIIGLRPRRPRRSPTWFFAVLHLRPVGVEVELRAVVEVVALEAVVDAFCLPSGVSMSRARVRLSGAAPSAARPHVAPLDRPRGPRPGRGSFRSPGGRGAASTHARKPPRRARTLRRPADDVAGEAFGVAVAPWRLLLERRQSACVAGVSIQTS
jgi:hypothetical protein